MKNSYDSMATKNNLILKWAKDLNRHVFEDVKVANKQMKMLNITS